MKRIEELTRQWQEQGLLLPIWFENGSLRLVDQLRLPFEEKILTITKVEELCSAICDMTIRGSGAIGIAGAYGMLLEAENTKGDQQAVLQAARALKATRPTAVNLMKTVDELCLAVQGAPADSFLERFYDSVCDLLERQLAFEHRLGENGAALINDGDTILTHCHSGALAGSGFGGRALSVIRTAHLQGKQIHVFTSETRPYLQGARITAYELGRFGIPHTLITDGMSGYLMRLGKIQKAVVGSDRVAANGDLLNKIGTYMHALAARENGVPFYTATSSHTIDFGLKQGMDMGVEFRAASEVTHLNGQPIAPAGTQALYPSFDVTPNALLSGIITEKKVVLPCFEKNLQELQTQF